jgi:hypothetical protein
MSAGDSLKIVSLHWATAQVHAMLLVTRNVKDFPDGDPGVRAPYKL